MYGDSDKALSQSTSKRHTGASRKFGSLLHQLTDSGSESEDDTPEPKKTPEAPVETTTAKPWLRDFLGYLNSKDDLGGLTIVEWWGVSAHSRLSSLVPLLISFTQYNEKRYPVWASLARDYLSVMAGSVSSERSFSSAGITISKRRNRLKADIVEALQCLKSMSRRSLLFREMPSTLLEGAALESTPSVEAEHEGSEGQVVEVNAGPGWDAGVEGIDDEDDTFYGGDEDDVYVNDI